MFILNQGKVLGYTDTFNNKD